MTTPTDMINLALIDIGATPVQSTDTPPGDVYLRQYEIHVGALVSSYPWTFQTELVSLARLTAPPELHWQYMYELPADMEGAPRAVYNRPDLRQPTHDWERRGNRLYSNQPELWLRYTLPPAPQRWPAHFTALAILVLKAQFALSVREDTALWKTLTAMAFGSSEPMGEGGKLGEAKMIDAGGKPSDVIPIGSNPLTAVRFT
jgi:hypothetical protein